METLEIETGRSSAITTVELSGLTESASNSRSLQHACLCAQGADDYRGQDTLVLDLTGVTPIVDYFVITTGTSRRQMHAIAQEADRVLADEGCRRLGREGYDGSSWLLQDYGNVVLHIFLPETRELYDLEHLWADAKQVDWEGQNQDRP